MYIQILHICMYLITINKKEPMTLKESKEGYMEEFEERKREGGNGVL